MTASIKQIGAVTSMNLRNVPSRLGTSLVIVIGIAGVVAVMVALLSMAKGFQETLASTGRADRAIVLRGGSTDELSSVIARDQATLIMDAPGVARGADGKPLALAELYILTGLAKRGQDTPNNVVVRGTQPNVLDVRTQAKIVEGRMFTPGLREVVVGRGAQSQFEGLEVGGSVEVRDGHWPIVGVFESDGDVHESELWVDAESLTAASRRQAYTTVTVQLENAEGFDAYKAALTTDPRLNVQVQREPDYYASRSEMLSALIRILGYTVAVIMAIGALFGALNTMYAAVATRTTEIATLRALGFGGLPVVLSVLIEALLLAVAGGALGGVLAYLFFNGYTVSTLNFQSFSQVAFAFKVTPDLLVQGVILGAVIGLVGGLMPALRAARLPVTVALRAA